MKKNFYRSEYAKNFAGTSNKYAKACKFLSSCKRVLDIGCGDGSFLKMLQSNSSVEPELYGIDISEIACATALKKGIHAFCLDIDEEQFPFENEFFDGIFCGEVIEHLYDPDQLLQEIHRVIKSTGICILTTPNLASWYNRIFLLLGYQPLFTEVSIKHGVGHPFPFWLKAGHLRLFTLKALRELIKLNRFKINLEIGFGINTNLGFGKRFKIFAGFVNKLFSRPTLASDIMIVMGKE